MPITVPRLVLMISELVVCGLLNYILRAEIAPTPLTKGSMVVLFGLSVFLWIKGFEPSDHETIPCPTCGFGNIPERRICKRCRSERATAPPRP